MRKNQSSEAIAHARKYLNGAVPEQHLSEFQSAMGLLVMSQRSRKELNSEYQVSETKIFGAHGGILRKALLDENRWNKLIDQFRLDMFKLNQMGHQSKFTAVLQSGLSALKTPYAVLRASGSNTPVHTHSLLAEPVLIKSRR